MLQHLHISNYALISELSIDFAAGFSVITGETGAGKSILLGALGLLCGERADVRTVKQGERKCVVEAEFSLDRDMRETFESADLDYDDGLCIVRREVNASGKSRAFVNDTPTTLAALRTIAAGLFDIHSQHRNLLLGEENFLLETLDALSPSPSLLPRYREAFRAWKQAETQLQGLREKAQKGREDEEYLRFQLSQLDEADLREGEQEELETEQDTLEHAEEIKQGLLAASGLLAGGEEASVVSALRSATAALRSIERVFPKAEELAERVESSRIELEDIASDAETSAERTDFDPRRLEAVSERLDTIYGLEKKHGLDDIGALLSLADELRERLRLVDNIDDVLAEKERETALLDKACAEAAEALTKARWAVASELEKALAERIASLGMKSGRVQFSITPREGGRCQDGADAVAMLFSANKNVAPVDVASVASGGEVSRLMLALKSIIAQRRSLPTVIFDEIDTGVSGTMAEKMALAMRAMSQQTQVISITHLPQIAALGDAHYKVFKQEDDQGVTSHIRRLCSEAERVEEIANMLSGERLTPEAIENAKALLNNHQH